VPPVVEAAELEAEAALGDGTGVSVVIERRIPEDSFSRLAGLLKNLLRTGRSSPSSKSS